MTHHYGSSPNIRARRPAGPLLVGLIAIVTVATLVPSVGGSRASADETASKKLNSWPFPGFSNAEIQRYIDERTTALAINLVTGRAILTLEDPDGTIDLPLSWVDPRDQEILPVLPVKAPDRHLISSWRSDDRRV